jgi:hypothetical protein
MKRRLTTAVEGKPAINPASFPFTLSAIIVLTVTQVTPRNIENKDLIMKGSMREIIQQSLEVTFIYQLNPILQSEKRLFHSTFLTILYRLLYNVLLLPHLLKELG